MTVAAGPTLPAQVNGALLSLGDCHTAQGDSEFDGTAIETSITATLRLTLHKKADMKKARPCLSCTCANPFPEALDLDHGWRHRHAAGRSGHCQTSEWQLPADGGMMEQDGEWGE